MRDQDEIYEAATETPASLGCPSLVPGTVVVHDEPDYEMLARELTRDGFDADRLAKAIEAEASKRPIDYPTFYTPGWLAELAKKMQSEAEAVNKNKTVKKPVSWPEGYAIEMEKNGRKIVGVITESGMYLGDDTYPYRFGATVYDGEDILFAIDSCSRGISFQKRVLKSAMSEAIQILSHMRRYRANKKAKEGGAA